MKKDTNVAAYIIHSTDVIPPRFNWSTGSAQAPGRNRVCIRASSHHSGYHRCSIN